MKEPQLKPFIPRPPPKHSELIIVKILIKCLNEHNGLQNCKDKDICSNADICAELEKFRANRLIPVA
jgi:hypothetical protein